MTDSKNNQENKENESQEKNKKDSSKEQGCKKEKDIKVLKDKIEQLEKLTQKYLNGWKRARADYQNREKEIQKEKEKWMKFSNLKLIKELLYILDSFQHSLDQAPEDLADNDWVKGIIQISNQFEQFLKGQGVEKIKTVGKEFDPKYHEAVNKGSEDNQGNKIKKEVQAGYIMHGQVIRPAKVVVE